MKKQADNTSHNSPQIISVNADNKVISSDNNLIKLENGSLLSDYHPFFFIIREYFNSQEKNYTIDCVNINEQIFDIEVIVKNNDHALIVLNDETEFYNKFQAISQKKNESIIFSEVLELKNKILKTQQEFKNRFIGNLSHELKNPLTLITAFSSLLRKTELDLDQNKLVEAIHNQSNHLMNILNDITDLSVLNAGKMELKSSTFSLNKLIEQILLDYTTSLTDEMVKIKLNMDPNLPGQIITDRRRFEQIITNFLDNAIQHNKGRFIYLNLQENQRRANKVSLRIEVKTFEGIIPSNSQVNASDAIESWTKGDISRTSGLGISIAQEIALLMEGEIRIKQLEEGGTSQIANVKVAFPIHQREIIDEKAVKEVQKVVLKEKIRTIIAEEHSVAQMTLLKVLVSTGNFDTEVYSDPKLLLDAVAKEEYDLILMASSISHLDAVELMSMIKEFSNAHNKKVPIIAVTTRTSSEDLSMYRKAGFKDIVKKPYTDDELINTIYKRLNLKKFQ